MKKKNLYKKKFIKNNLKNLTTFKYFSLRSVGFNFFSKNNFESIRRFLSRKFKKKLKFSIIKITNKCPTFKKSQKSRMGKGKGKFNFWFWKICKNQKLLEISFFKKKNFIFFFLKKLCMKLSIKSFITNV